MGATNPPGKGAQGPPKDELELDDAPRPKGTMADDLYEEPTGLRAALPLVLGGIAFVATIAVLLWLAGVINHVVDKVRPEFTGTAPGEVTYAPSKTDVVPGVVFVDSHPPGGTVKVDGKVIGRTPVMLQMKLTTKTVVVEIDSGKYKTWRRTIPVKDGGIHVDAHLK